MVVEMIGFDIIDVVVVVVVIIMIIVDADGDFKKKAIVNLLF